MLILNDVRLEFSLLLFLTTFLLIGDLGVDTSAYNLFLYSLVSIIFDKFILIAFNIFVVSFHSETEHNVFLYANLRKVNGSVLNL